jgi:5-methylcytosine-specific restriction protein A
MAFQDITREAVLAAIAEYDELGQDEFLARYGFDRARAYLLFHDGKEYDSKAIVGVAHRFLPGERALSAREFSGGEATVGHLLRRLGFTVQVGELTTARLIRLLTSLNVYYSNGLPALYQPFTLLWAISRAARGEPRLVSWAETGQEVSALVECYGRPDETPRVYYPIAALHNAGLWELDADAAEVPNAHGSTIPQRWFDDHQPRNGLVASVHNLVRDSPEARSAAVHALVEKYFVDAPQQAALLNELGLLASTAEIALSDLAIEYRRLCERADIFWTGREDTRVPRASADPIRSRAARRAVILRSKGRCENPDCSGDIQDVTDRGEPLLEVDHIQDLALDGEDNPAQMIALCPNCHTIKTHGRSREQLRPKLLIAAKRLHQDLFADDQGAACAAGMRIRTTGRRRAR